MAIYGTPVRTVDHDLGWAATLVGAAVLSALVAFWVPLGGVLAPLVLALSLWRLRHTGELAVKAFLWAAVVASATVLLLLVVATFATTR
ncbi:hypothetical protein [Cellulomonas sp. URHB0016]